ncbi:alpha/beta fold hydrolase [Geodermatophilus sp. CPCC 206100]|uniref:alpha/beta fold hydrolase n=1 Tax=Geodermatophilus sp. CPCC 206100 TaxID=3020054 RepID=UPI003B00629C
MDLQPVPWPPGARSATVTLGGDRVRLLDLGGPEDAPVVLCVHGLGASAITFGLVGPLLAGRHRVLAVDLLAHGGSAVGADAAAGNRRLIGRVVESVVGTPVVLVGQSMGGVLAIQHAAEAPDTVRRLVLIGPPVPRPTRLPVDPILAARRAFLRLPPVERAVAARLRRMTPEEAVDAQVRQATPHVDRVPADVLPVMVAETRERAARPDAAAAQAAQWRAITGTMAVLVHARRFRETVARISAPTLYLQGEDDPLAPVAAARALAATRPDWRLEVFPGVGHVPHVEDPQGTADRVLRWLAEPVARQAGGTPRT